MNKVELDLLVDMLEKHALKSGLGSNERGLLERQIFLYKCGREQILPNEWKELYSGFLGRGLEYFLRELKNYYNIRSMRLELIEVSVFEAGLEHRVPDEWQARWSNICHVVSRESERHSFLEWLKEYSDSGVLGSQLDIYRAGMEGSIPGVWKKLHEEYMRESDPEYKEYLRLKEKFS